MEKTYAFFGTEAQRTANVVRHVERGHAGAFDPNETAAGMQVIAAHLTARGTSDAALYSWKQARRDGTNWAELADGLSGTFTNCAAIDISPTNGTNGSGTDLTGTFVQLARAVTGAGSNSLACWHVVNAAGSLPRPRAKYSVLICINNSEDVAFDNPRFA